MYSVGPLSDFCVSGERCRKLWCSCGAPLQGSCNFTIGITTPITAHIFISSPATVQVITFDMRGISGHPNHVAACQGVRCDSMIAHGSTLA